MFSLIEFKMPALQDNFLESCLIPVEVFINSNSMKFSFTNLFYFYHVINFQGVVLMVSIITLRFKIYEAAFRHIDMKFVHKHIQLNILKNFISTFICKHLIFCFDKYIGIIGKKYKLGITAYIWEIININ